MLFPIYLLLIRVMLLYNVIWSFDFFAYTLNIEQSTDKNNNEEILVKVAGTTRLQDFVQSLLF